MKMVDRYIDIKKYYYEQYLYNWEITDKITDKFTEIYWNSSIYFGFDTKALLIGQASWINSNHKIANYIELIIIYLSTTNQDHIQELHSRVQSIAKVGEKLHTVHTHKK